MKKLLLLLFCLGVLGSARAIMVTTNSSTSQTITVTGSSYDLQFRVTWWADDYPLSSVPGMLELFGPTGTLVGRVRASSYQSTGIYLYVESGTVDGASSSIARFASSGGPADGEVRGTWHLTGLTPGNYTLTLWSYQTRETTIGASSVWTDSLFDGSAGPINQAPTVQWVVAPATVGHQQGYFVSAQGHDDDWNLQEVRVWKNATLLVTAGAGNGTDSQAGGSTSDNGPQTVTFFAQAFDAAGAESVVISHTVTVSPPPPPVQYTVTTLANTGGTVSAGGTYNTGTVVVISAVPDALHDFSGWSGDASGASASTSLTVDRDLTVVANFSPRLFALTTSAQAGGTVTPGGSYPYGTNVTVNAVADALHYFTGWSGDGSGSDPSLGVLLDRAKAVQAQFAAKAAQVITFANPGDQPSGAVLPLAATASSGLPVNFVILSGPAVVSGNQLTLGAVGAITVRAEQPGDARTLPALPVDVTFNALIPVEIKYRPAARTLLRDRNTSGINYVIGNP